MADVLDLRAVEVTLNAVPGVRNARVGDDGDVLLDVSADADEEQVRRDVSSVLTMVFDVPASAPEIPTQRERLTLIRGGLTEPTAPQQPVVFHPLAGLSPQVPDVDVDLQTEEFITHPAAGILDVTHRRDVLRFRERSAFIPMLDSGDAPRPQLVRLRTRSTAELTTVSVILTWAGILIEGTADAPSTASAVRFATVSATLAALSRLIPPEITFAVESVAPVELADVDAAVVLITMTGPDGSQQLTGVSVVREDSRAALARATLDAVNRRIAALLNR